jgi:hypothetical protein
MPSQVLSPWSVRSPPAARPSPSNLQPFSLAMYNVLRARSGRTMPTAAHVRQAPATQATAL